MDLINLLGGVMKSFAHKKKIVHMEMASYMLGGVSEC